MNVTGAGQSQFVAGSNTRLATGKEPKSVSVADYNGDCYNDLVVSEHMGKSLGFFFWNNATGSFSPRSGVTNIPDLTYPTVSIPYRDQNSRRWNFYVITRTSNSSGRVPEFVNTGGLCSSS